MTMKVPIKEIVDQMSPDVRTEVEKAAKDQGVSVEQFVGNQLSARLREDDMTIEIEEVNWDVHADHTYDPRGDRTRVHGGLRGRF